MKSVYQSEIEIQFKHLDVTFFRFNEIFTKEYIFRLLAPFDNYFKLALSDRDVLNILYEKFKKSLIKDLREKVVLIGDSDLFCKINDTNIYLELTGYKTSPATQEDDGPDAMGFDAYIDFEYKLVREDEFGDLSEFHFTAPCENTYDYIPPEEFIPEIFKVEKSKIFDAFLSLSINENHYGSMLYQIFINAVNELFFKDFKNAVSFQHPYKNEEREFLYFDGKAYSSSVLGLKEFEMSSEILRKLSLLDLEFSVEQFMHDGLYPFSACGTLKFDAGNWIVNCRLEVEGIKEIFEKDIKSRFGLIGEIVFKYQNY